MANGNQPAAARGNNPPAGMSAQEYADLRQTLKDDIMRDQQARGRLKLELPTFSGSKSPLEAQAFLRDAEGYREACGLGEAQLIQAVQFALRDEAKTWGSNLTLTSDLATMPWADYRVLFEARFGLTMSPSEKAKLTESLAQKAEESVRSFYDRCQSAELILLANNTIYQAQNNGQKTAMREQGICEKFLRGLREAGDLKGYVNGLAPMRGQNAISLREYYEAAIQKEQTITDRRKSTICEVSNAEETSDTHQVMEVQKRTDLSKIRCFRCSRMGHFRRDCKVRLDPGVSPGGGQGRPGAGRGWGSRAGGQGGQRFQPGFRSTGGWRRPGARVGAGGVNALETIRQAADALLEVAEGEQEDVEDQDHHFQ